MKLLHCTTNRSLFLLLGLSTRYIPDDDSGHDCDYIQESEGARIARRNNLALAGLVVASALIGAGPQDLDVFGMKASDPTAALVVYIMVIACHIYWYLMRWQHLCDDAEILVFSTIMGQPPLLLREESPRRLRQKSAVLVANQVCFVLVVLSVVISVLWGIRLLGGGGRKGSLASFPPHTLSRPRARRSPSENLDQMSAAVAGDQDPIPGGVRAAPGG